jgi:hypothetical protein
MFSSFVLVAQVQSKQILCQTIYTTTRSRKPFLGANLFSVSRFDNSDHDPNHGTAPQPAVASWRIKTQQEYIRSLSPNEEIRKKGGLAKLEKQPTNRYFKRTKLSDIIMLHGKATSAEEQDELALFVHFLLGILGCGPMETMDGIPGITTPIIIGGRTNRITPENVNEKHSLGISHKYFGYHHGMPLFVVASF